jgi:predicted glycoside hydrolase/deacetylase ChbG (UPF0249 family)
VVFVRAWVAGQVRREEVALELAAQIDRARALGVAPDHLDGHQHLHLLPGVRQEVEALAEREGLPLRFPVRWPSAARWRAHPRDMLKEALLWALGQIPGGARVRRVPGWGTAEAGRLDEPTLLGLLEALPEGDVEIGCHPGLGTPDVPEEPGWRYRWEDECRALCSPQARAVVARRGIQLVNYSQLART